MEVLQQSFKCYFVVTIDADIVRRVEMLDERMTKVEAGALGGKQSSTEICLDKNKEESAQVTARKAGTSPAKVKKVPMAEKKRVILERQARERMESGANQYSPTDIFPEGSKGETRDILGKTIGVSGTTYDNSRHRTLSDDPHPGGQEPDRKQLELFFLSCFWAWVVFSRQPKTM